MAAVLPLFIGRGVDSMRRRGLRPPGGALVAAAIVGFAAVKGDLPVLDARHPDRRLPGYRVRSAQRPLPHLTDLSSDFYGRTRTGDIMARATNDLNAVRMMLGPGFMYWLETGFTFFSWSRSCSYVDWRLTLLALLPAPAGQPGRELLRPASFTTASSTSRRCSPTSAAACRRTSPACAWCAPTCRRRPSCGSSKG